MNLLAAAAAASWASPAGALEYMPIYNASVMGGQYFMEGSRGHLSGNVSATAAPVLKKDDKWSFIPMYVVDYIGTKGMDDGVGAGTIYQQKMDHRLSFKAIRSMPGTAWKLKPSASYKREFLKETKDESWGYGLFDYQKIAVGFEAENTYREPFTYRLGMDIYRINFPNYSSLESAAGTDPQGNPLGRELASKKVLDTMNYQLSANASYPYPYENPVVSLSGGYSLLYQDYYDQRRVNMAGQLVAGGRRDYQQTLSMGAAYPRDVVWFDKSMRLDTSFNMSLAYNGSNQNTYDAVKTKYIPDSYSYYSMGMGPTFTLAWGDKKRPAWTSLGFRYSSMQYLGRLVQDGNGVYQDENQQQDRYLLGLTYSYPMGKALMLKVQTNMLWARSNQRYEKTYAYNYQTANYLMGFTYEY